MLPYHARRAGRWADESFATEGRPRPSDLADPADRRPGLVDGPIHARQIDGDDEPHGHREPLTRALGDVQAFGTYGF